MPDHPLASQGVENGSSTVRRPVTHQGLPRFDYHAFTRAVLNLVPLSTQQALRVIPHLEMQTLSRKLLELVKDATIRNKILKALERSIADHPWNTAFIVVGVVLMINPLNILGFGALGPVAGSLAAAWQSVIGNVAAGSLFAMLQSIGMLHALTIPLAGAGITAVSLLARGDLQKWIAGEKGTPVKDWVESRAVPVNVWAVEKIGNPIVSWWKARQGNKDD